MTYITCDKDRFSSQVCFVKTLATLLVWIAPESLGEFDFSYLHSTYDDSKIETGYGIDKKLVCYLYTCNTFFPSARFRVGCFLIVYKNKFVASFVEIVSLNKLDEDKAAWQKNYLFDERFNEWNIGLFGTASNWWRHSSRCFTLSSAMELENFFIQIIVLGDVRLDLFVFLAIFLLILL